HLSLHQGLRASLRLHSQRKSWVSSLAERNLALLLSLHLLAGPFARSCLARGLVGSCPRPPVRRAQSYLRLSRSSALFHAVVRPLPSRQARVQPESFRCRAWDQSILLRE